MKSNILSLMDDLGLVWKYALSGLIGGFVWSLYEKSKFWEALRKILIGGIISGYFTPVIILKYNIDLGLAGFISFIIGMLGMIILDTSYKYAVNNYKKWGMVLKILFGGKDLKS